MAHEKEVAHPHDPRIDRNLESVPSRDCHRVQRMMPTSFLLHHIDLNVGSHRPHENCMRLMPDELAGDLRKLRKQPDMLDTSSSHEDDIE